MELKDMFRIVWRRAGIIAAIVLLACLAAGFVSVYLLQPEYEASTKLIVNKSSAAEDGEALLSWDDVTVNIQLISTYKELILTGAIMDEVVRQHPEIGLTSRELMQKVNVSSVNETQVMTVVARDASYERAALIVNAVSTIFQSKVIEIMKVDNVTILNRASTDEKAAPVSPNPPMNVMISFVLALIFSVGVVFLIEHLDDTIKNEKDVLKYAELPALATIFKVEKKDLAKPGSERSKRKSGDSVYVTANQ